nr:unnamed protein product [Callosobruchus analis]
MAIHERIKEVKRMHLCINCLRANHFAEQCKSKTNCRTCNKRHNSLLHLEKSSPNMQSNIQTDDTTAQISSMAEVADSNLISAHVTNPSKSQNVLLATAVVLIKDSSNNVHKVRALLDGASQSNFITKSLCNLLNIKGSSTNIPVVGVGNTQAKVFTKTLIQIQSVQDKSFQVKLSCLVIEKITQDIPNFYIDPTQINIPQNLSLADQNYYEAGEVQLLLGAGIFYDMLLPGKISLGKNMPVCQNSRLGWFLAGNITMFMDNQISCNLTMTQCNKQLHEQIEKFWAIEECSHTVPLTKEEEECEALFKQTTIREEETGKFIVTLPIRENSGELGDSFETAKSQFFSLEKKLQKNKDLKGHYTEFMNEYQALGHMTKIEPHEVESFTNNIFYCPHHAVINENSSTTRVRVVFNASSKTSSGISLNDKLKVGPVLQDELFCILIRFRKYNFVIGADITKMYRQILVTENQRDLQRIIWRSNPEDELQHFRLNTVTYGTAPASYLSIRCLNEIAYQKGQEHPEACDAILNNFYVDDFLGGTDTIEKAIELKSNLSLILKEYGFVLRKWVANEPQILSVEDHTVSKNHEIKRGNEAQKTLGLLWQSNHDVLNYTVNNGRVRSVTKRAVLSMISQIFDPLGLIGPTTIQLKILMQQLWQSKLDWDDSLPVDLLNTWAKTYDQLEHLNEITIPRQVISFGAKYIEVHGFSDSSERAYGACLYLKSVNEQESIEVRLLCAKSRVAPLKSISLPWLELCGALLLAQLYSKVVKAIKLPIFKSYLWTDSTIVLSWLAAPPKTWKTFVANRVAEIQTLSETCEWRHVPSFDNPADIISRGLEPTELKSCTLWWSGPGFLKQTSEGWPNQFICNTTNNNLERKPICLVNTNVTSEFDIFGRYSSLYKLQRIVALCLRFKRNLTVNRKNRIAGAITGSEQDEALLVLAKLAQQTEFRKDIIALKQNGVVSAKSKLKTLCPFLDERGLIRVGGRLGKAPVPYDKRFPIVLSKNHALTKLIIRDEHYRNLHAGPQAVLCAVRRKFWPLSGKIAVRSALKSCIACFRVKPVDIVRVMGELPQDRVTAHRPFFTTGVDFCGPFNLRDGKVRSRKIVKGYMCIFICFTTRCVHLELVGDLSSDAFLNCLKRFISRRGICGRIFSDNATNFKGADNELRRFAKEIKQAQSVSSFCEKNCIEWNYIPPRSPHQGGYWEAAVRAAKYHIKRIMGNVNLTFEELSTIFCQVEAVMNSRPLTPLSNDPSDLSVLTPSHFLIGDVLTALPQADVKSLPDNRLRHYLFLQKLMQHFWSRWSNEYLSSLQKRAKWYSSSSCEPKVGDLVVLKDENTAPQFWRLGRIQNLHPGSDGVVRVLSIKTVNGIVTRAIQRVCLLPIEHP